MNPEVFAEWLRRQGHRVIRTQSSYWYDAAPLVFQAFPFHWSITPSELELRTLLVSDVGVALRYSAPVCCAEGRLSYHVVCEDRAYDARTLDRRARQNVRRGLEACTVRTVPLERIADEGWPLEQETCARNGRQVALDADAWRRRYLAAAVLPGFEGWAAIVGKRLAACVLGLRIDDWYVLISQQCATEFEAARVNNALTFVVTSEVLRREGVGGVFYALQSLDAPATVDEFKFRMGYVARPVRQRVLFHPLFAESVAPVALRMVHDVARHLPANRVLAKAEGLLKFHLEGMRPASAQALPDRVQYHVLTHGTVTPCGAVAP